MTRIATPALIVATLCTTLLWNVAHGATGSPDREAPWPVLRVCSDPNNLPFSSARRDGFENRIADLLARDLRTTIEYTWWAQRRGFLRNTLTAGVCDVVIGYPTGAEMVLTTRPYYRSTYVFVTRSSRRLRIRSFDDPQLRRLRVGVQLVGDDGANTPPAHALSRRGVVGNLVGYSVYGDYRTNSPPSAIVSAVARGDVDVATVWGPLAGFFAASQTVPLDLIPVQPQLDDQLPQAFDISMAVRSDDRVRLDRLNRFLQQQQAEIARILALYHVPRVDHSSAAPLSVRSAVEGQEQP
jgi:mxaJ protein